ncbi:MAG: hypothetical protein IIY09_02690 [Clostridia bacterium]|nr:hypothetical protein [Clostridia bacterium]
MNYLPLFLAVILLNLPRNTVQSLSSKRVLALVRGINVLKKSGFLDLLKTENPLGAFLSGEIKPEQLLPVITAFAPLLQNDKKDFSPSPPPKKQNEPNLFPQELKDLYAAVWNEKEKGCR